MINTKRFRDFIVAMEAVVDRSAGESEILGEGTSLVASLVCSDDWLPVEYAVENPDRYQQFLLHCDPRERFSVVSFVWGPGQSTPVHDHCTWGIVGVLRGIERSQFYSYRADGFGARAEPVDALPGSVDVVSPTLGDIHRVANASTESTAVSIHVYGANIGTVRRHVYDDAGHTREFISGYVPTPYALLWGA